jgi:hypothetical protein
VNCFAIVITFGNSDVAGVTYMTSSSALLFFLLCHTNVTAPTGRRQFVLSLLQRGFRYAHLFSHRDSMLQMTGVSCEAAVLARRCADSFIDHYWATVTRHYSGAADSADKAHPHTLAAISLSVTLTLLRTWGVDSVEQTACQRLTVRAARFNSTIHHTTFFNFTHAFILGPGTT